MKTPEFLLMISIPTIILASVIEAFLLSRNENVDQWRGLFIDLFRARKIGDVLGFLAKPPGWRPDGPGETTEELRRRANSAPMP